MKFKALLSAALLAALATAAQAEIKVGIMNEPYPPLFTKDASGQWVGFEVELLNAVCAEMKEDCTIVDISWDGLIPGLLSNKIDLIWSSMSITEKRKEQIAFTDKYYATPTVLIGSKDQADSVAPEALAGKIVGVQVSTIQAEYFAKYFAAQATSKTYSTMDESFQDLVVGRVDYVLADAMGAQSFVDSDTGKDCCKVVGQVADDPVILGAGVGGGVRKEDTELVAKINAAVQTLRTNGKYEEIAKKYFSFDPYGN